MKKHSHKIRVFGLIFVMATMLALLTTSCGIRFNFTGPKIETGPTQTMNIQVPMPESASMPVDLNLEFVAGKLILSPGDGEALVSGTAAYNADEFVPIIETAGSSTTINQGDLEVEGFSGCPDDVVNTWNLNLANTPMDLNIKAGAYDGEFEFGGLSLNKLEIWEGGSDVSIAFTTPNNSEMSSFIFNTGASHTHLSGLANANFSEMDFKSGAGEYTLSFDGDLQRDASVKIDSGMATLNIIVPEGTTTQLTFQGGMSTINLGSGWLQNGDVYTHAGSGPTITISLNMGAGTLNLESK